jgi:hypothetical protein
MKKVLSLSALYLIQSLALAREVRVTFDLPQQWHATVIFNHGDNLFDYHCKLYFNDKSNDSSNCTNNSPSSFFPAITIINATPASELVRDCWRLENNQITLRLPWDKQMLKNSSVPDKIKEILLNMTYKEPDRIDYVIPSVPLNPHFSGNGPCTVHVSPN